MIVAKTPEEVLQDKLSIERQLQINEINQKLEEIDKQRIRALCEPLNRTTNQTWLDYYNLEAKKLREKLNKINNQ